MSLPSQIRRCRSQQFRQYAWALPGQRVTFVVGYDRNSPAKAAHRLCLRQHLRPDPRRNVTIWSQLAIGSCSSKCRHPFVQHPCASCQASSRLSMAIPYYRSMNLDVSDEEAAALAKEIANITGKSRRKDALCWRMADELRPFDFECESLRGVRGVPVGRVPHSDRVDD